HVTWIAHPEATFRLTGMSGVSSFRTYAGAFDAVAASLRPLTSEERAGIQELRLQVVQARAGETLEALSQRTGNRWPLPELAVANALSPGTRLEAGALVKIAVPRPLRD